MKIDWYIMLDDETGKEAWRVPISIGPLSVEHNHWAGWHLDGLEEGDAEAILEVLRKRQAKRDFDLLVEEAYAD